MSSFNPLTPTQLENLNHNVTISLYIPRIHRKYSSRDIRIRMQHALGHPVLVDLAYNSSIGFNMAFIFITTNSNPSTNLSSLLQELKIQTVKFWPEGNLSKSVFWLIIPSKCDHIAEETNEMKQIENLSNFLEITTVNDIDNIILDHEITNISD